MIHKRVCVNRRCLIQARRARLAGKARHEVRSLENGPIESAPIPPTQSPAADSRSPKTRVIPSVSIPFFSTSLLGGRPRLSSTARIGRMLVHLVYLVYLVCLVDQTGNSSKRTRQTRKTGQPDRRARARCASTGDHLACPHPHLPQLRIDRPGRLQLTLHQHDRLHRQ